MKNIKIKILSVLLLAGAMSCTNLDEEPVGLLAPEGFFKSKKDVETAIFGVYGAVAGERLFGRQFVSALMLRSDMCDIGNKSTSAARVQMNDFSINASNSMISAFWPQWYVAISCANSAEAGAKSLGLTDEDINPLIAEARFDRAFCYFHMVRTFGAVPYIDYPVTDPEKVKNLIRTPEADVYKAIIADLEFAKQWLPNKQPGDIRTRPTKGTAACYLASVYLTFKEYQKAYTEAKYVIENKDLFGYQLEADFQDLYRAPMADQLKETIFAFDFLGNVSGTDDSWFYNDDLMGSMTGVRDITGWGVVVPSWKVYQSFSDLDYRKQVSFDTVVVSPYSGETIVYPDWKEKRPHIAKWRRFPGNSNKEGRYTDHNYPDFRYAEVLLIAAEALGEVSGPTDEAKGYVNQVRARARNAAGTINTYPADVPNSLDKTAFIDLVLEERRIELAFEWKRWYDIKRRNLGDIMFKGTNSLEPQPKFDASRDYLMPIPKTELDVNPNLAPQNNGY